MTMTERDKCRWHAPPGATTCDVYACETCGSLNIQWTCWVYANHEYRGPQGEPPLDDAWCDRCEELASTMCVTRVQLADGRDGWARSWGGLGPTPPGELRAVIRAMREGKRPKRLYLGQKT